MLKITGVLASIASDCWPSKISTWISNTCAVHREDCRGWCLSSCHSSVAEHRLHKVSVLGLIPNKRLLDIMWQKREK